MHRHSKPTTTSNLPTPPTQEEKGGERKGPVLVASAVFGSLQTKDDRPLLSVPNPLPCAQLVTGRREAGTAIGNDSDESQPTMPTPLAKTAQALHTIQDHTIPHGADRYWMAFEHGDAYQKIINGVCVAEDNIEGNLYRSLESRGVTRAGVAAKVAKYLSPQFKSMEDRVDDKKRPGMPSSQR